jgi:citrate synthase
MMYAVPCEEYEVDPVAEKALDLLFILHADHEQIRLDGSLIRPGQRPAETHFAVSAHLDDLAHGDGEVG